MVDEPPQHARGEQGLARRDRPHALDQPLAALASSYAIGAIIALATDLGSLTNGTKTSAPSFIPAVELLAAFAVYKGRIAGAWALAAMSGLSTAAFAFDGDFANDVLSPGHVVWQGVEDGLALVVLGLSAALIRTR